MVSVGGLPWALIRKAKTIEPLGINKRDEL